LSVYEILCTLLGKNISAKVAPVRSGDIKHSCADINKAYEMFGYDPEFGFEKGIELCVEWYKEVLG